MKSKLKWAVLFLPFAVSLFGVNSAWATDCSPFFSSRPVEQFPRTNQVICNMIKDGPQVKTKGVYNVGVGRGVERVNWGHRGLWQSVNSDFRQAENTLGSLRLAADFLLEAVEIDVRVDASGGVWVTHDPQLERLSAKSSSCEFFIESPAFKFKNNNRVRTTTLCENPIHKLSSAEVRNRWVAKVDPVTLKNKPWPRNIDNKLMSLNDVLREYKKIIGTGTFNRGAFPALVLDIQDADVARRAAQVVRFSGMQEHVILKIWFDVLKPLGHKDFVANLGKDLYYIVEFNGKSFKNRRLIGFEWTGDVRKPIDYLKGRNSTTRFDERILAFAFGWPVNVNGTQHQSGSNLTEVEQRGIFIQAIDHINFWKDRGATVSIASTPEWGFKRKGKCIVGNYQNGVGVMGVYENSIWLYRNRNAYAYDRTNYVINDLVVGSTVASDTAAKKAGINIIADGNINNIYDANKHNYLCRG